MNFPTGLLLSGDLGLVALKHLIKRSKIKFVFTNKSSTEIIDFCNYRKIPVFTGNPRKKKTETKEFIKNKRVDYIFSINYLYIIEQYLLAHPQIHAINFHGSLLPRYRGRTPHVWAIINGETTTGITAHLMEEKCDSGAILKQKEIPIYRNDTGSDLLEKFKYEYPGLMDELINNIYDGNIQYYTQDEAKATYFGKRTPEDGEINWNWQKERIRNWVRAQSYPYPGAFTFYRGYKIIIDEIQFSEMGFSYDIPNGTILNTEPVPFVKTPNGVIALSKVRKQNELLYTKNNQFEMKYINHRINA